MPLARAPESRQHLVLFASLACLVLLLLTTSSSHYYAHDVLLPPQGFGAIGSLAVTARPTPAKPLSRAQLREIVGESPRFLAKDSQISYGYNNLRYMFEATMNLATLTGRIPILPEAVWARGCAVDSEVCTEHSLRHFGDRNQHEEELGAKWNEEGEIWELPIEEFLDVEHLRNTYGPVLTLREFFNLFSLNTSLIHPSGHFDPERYLPPGLCITTIPSDEFEHHPMVRVDRLDQEWVRRQVPEEKLKVTQQKMGWKTAWTLKDARVALMLSADNESAIAELGRLGQVPLYTFSDEVLMNKAAARPSTEFAPFSSLLPLTNITRISESSEILYLQGALHDQRKHGALRFSTASARDQFAHSVWNNVRPPPHIWKLAESLVEEMERRVEGRRWVTAHLRRGDFLGINWSDDNDPIAHFNIARECLADGKRVLAEHFPASVLPLSSDPFYLATDESNVNSLAAYRASGAVLLSDLLSPSEFSPFFDIRALVEQVIMSRADYFCGSRMSSTTGGAINMRLARGAEEWSWGLIGKTE